MPAHFCHLLFAEEVVRRAQLPEVSRAIEAYRPFFVLGAQGPDFFLHNQRTEPSSLTYGRLLHSYGYGDYCASFADHPDTSEKALAYLYGFVTHAALDRKTHPFIEYHSGWGDEYRGCHAVLERLIDVAVIRQKAQDTSMDFFAFVHCGEVLPKVLTDVMQNGLEETFPDNIPPDLAVRIANAYQDCLFFYRLTNPPDRAARLPELYDHDKHWEFKKLLSVLVHPDRLPAWDVLNASGTTWKYPASPEIPSNESFLDLYEAALPVAVEALANLEGYRNGDVERDQFIEIIGNGNLDNPSGLPGPVLNQVCDPLPIREYIAELYREIQTMLAINRSSD